MSFKIKNVAIFLKISIWFLLSRPFGSIIHKKGIPWERFPFAWKYRLFRWDNKWNIPSQWKFLGKKEYLGSAFLLHGNTGRSGVTTNGTVLPTGNFSEKRNTLGALSFCMEIPVVPMGQQMEHSFPVEISRKKGIPWERFPFAWKYRSFRCDNKWNSPSHLKGGASERSSAGQGRPDLPTQRVLRNSSVGDDRMGAKIKTPKNPLTKY